MPAAQDEGGTHRLSLELAGDDQRRGEDLSEMVRHAVQERAAGSRQHRGRRGVALAPVRRSQRRGGRQGVNDGTA